MRAFESFEKLWLVWMARPVMDGWMERTMWTKHIVPTEALGNKSHCFPGI